MTRDRVRPIFSSARFTTSSVLVLPGAVSPSLGPHLTLFAMTSLSVERGSYFKELKCCAKASRWLGLAISCERRESVEQAHGDVTRCGVP